MKGLFIPGFDYRVVFTENGSESIELHGEREFVELRSPDPGVEEEELSTLRNWRDLKDSLYLRWLLDCPPESPEGENAPWHSPSRPDSVTDDDLKEEIRENAGDLFLWRATHMPYSAVLIGATEYRVHTYRTRDHGRFTTYHIQIYMTLHVPKDTPK